MSYYKVLGVEENIDQDGIKKSFRKLSREFHPDLNPDNPEAEEQFKKINEAYSTLSDPSKRAMYDAQRHQTLHGGFQNNRAAGPGFNPFDIQSVFNEFFGGSVRVNAQKPKKKKAQRDGDFIQIRIPKKAIKKQRGMKVIVDLDDEEMCPSCAGVGGEAFEICGSCNGTGYIEEIKGGINIHIRTTNPCQTCATVGKIFDNPCTYCNTVGTVITKKRYKVNFKPELV
jgi:molecular chaperone DnaJ